ncbi:MAG: hypothetical protein JWS12_90 [Candidatus Saccharibacteria bacterium]|nr:hypothetical protein [Candidatus Saccharibacteria bacterium]
MNIFNSLGSNYSKRSGAYSLGSDAKAPARLQAYLKQHYRAPEVYLTYKGREAIALALEQLQLPKGSSVAINGYTCYAVYEAITQAGLQPLYLDIEKNQLNFTAERLSAALKGSPKINAVMIQNTLGMPADIQKIKTLCAEYKVPLVEDLAHSIGMSYSSGQEAGTVGAAAALSFSQDKMIDAVTGGAAVLYWASKIQPNFASAPLGHRFTTRLYPWATWLIRQTIRLQIGRVILKLMKSTKLLPGPMSGAATPAHKLPSWHSHIALQSYGQLPELIAHRQRIAAVYREWLPSTLQFSHDDTAVYLRFPIIVDKPLELIAQLRHYGVYLSDRWYDAPIAVAPRQVLKQTTYKKGECPNAEYVAARMVNLPTHIHVSEKKARAIAEHINAWLESKA